MPTTQNIVIDLNTRGANPVAFTHQGDTARTFVFEVYNNGEEFDVSSYSVKVAALLPADNGYYVIAGENMATGDTYGNTITVALPAEYTQKFGNGVLTLVLTGSGATIRPINIDLRIQKSADAPETIAGASDFIPVLQRYMAEDMQTYINAWLDAHPEAMQYYISGSKLVLDSNGILSIENDTDDIIEALDLDTLRSEVTDLKSDLQDYQDAISTHETPVNLFNKNSPLNRDGYKVSASGNYAALSGSSVSHPIKIDHTKLYCFKYSASYYGAAANGIIRRCDAEGNLIDLDSGFKNAVNVNNAYGYTATAFTGNYADWEYFCVNVRTQDKGVMIIAEGDTLPSYSDYFEPYWSIKTSALPDNLPLPSNAQINPLYNKKVAFTGDSICYGEGSSGGYAKIISENNNMVMSNIGVSGGTICSGTQRFCISESVDNMPENYDYYIVEGGVNDASQEHGETLGTLSTGYNATLDTTTIYGAMESLCKKLQLNFKGKKYGFIFPHNVYGDTSVWNTGWREAMKICLRKWGIPYIDLSDECAQLRNLDALRIYTLNGDGWHPTEDGYRLFYVDKITAWMKTL